MNVKSPQRKLRILIADDHLVVRMGLAALINLEPDMSVVGEADDGSTALELVRKLRPDIVVMDIMMPQMNGAKATAKISAEFPDVRILILTTYSTSEEVVQALNAGATGAIVKDSSQQELVSAIRRIHRGKKIVSPEITRSLDLTSAKPQLSTRQQEILNYVSKGLSNPEIGKLLGIGSDCVKAHLKTIYARLGVATRTEAVAFAVREMILHA